jgi:glutaredoxin
MDFNKIKISDTDFTILSKSNCKPCNEVKEYLIENNQKINVINCDEYISCQKDINIFLLYMEEIIGEPYGKFPMIFYNKKFVGGLNETKSMFDF